jgi:hypothetical protein
MLTVEDCKLEVMLAPSTVTLATNSSNYGYLDTRGWDYATILVTTRALATTSAVCKVLAITEGTNSTAASAIVALTGGAATSGSVGFVIPPFEGTAHGAIVQFNIDLRKRKRYLRLQVNPGNVAAGIGAVAILSRGKQGLSVDDGHVAAEVID